jgi:hypothetical protein
MACQSAIHWANIFYSVPYGRFSWMKTEKIGKFRICPSRVHRFSRSTGRIKKLIVSRNSLGSGTHLQLILFGVAVRFVYVFSSPLPFDTYKEQRTERAKRQKYGRGGAKDINKQNNKQHRIKWFGNPSKWIPQCVPNGCQNQIWWKNPMALWWKDYLKIPVRDTVGGGFRQGYMNEYWIQLGFSIYSQEYDLLKHMGFMLYNMAWMS